MTGRLPEHLTPVRRWCVVALVAVVLVAAPVAVRSLPAGTADVSSETLLEQARAERRRRLVGRRGDRRHPPAPGRRRVQRHRGLFGERTRLRVWWQDPDHWRVDRLLATGETDLFTTARRRWSGATSAPRPPSAATRRSGCRAQATWFHRCSPNGCCAACRRRTCGPPSPPAGWPVAAPPDCAYSPRPRSPASTTSTSGPTSRPASPSWSRSTPQAPRSPDFTSRFTDFSPGPRPGTPSPSRPRPAPTSSTTTCWTSRTRPTSTPPSVPRRPLPD